MKFEELEELLEKVLDNNPTKIPNLSRKMLLDSLKKEMEAKQSHMADEIDKGDADELTFELDNSTVNIETVNNLNVYNKGDLIVNKTNKMAIIESNLMKLAKLGIPFIRPSTYNVKVNLNGEYWNVYLSGKEKWMRDGMPEEGRGIDNFIRKYLDSQPVEVD